MRALVFVLLAAVAINTEAEAEVYNTIPVHNAAGVYNTPAVYSNMYMGWNHQYGKHEAEPEAEAIYNTGKGHMSGVMGIRGGMGMGGGMDRKVGMDMEGGMSMGGKMGMEGGRGMGDEMDIRPQDQSMGFKKHLSEEDDMSGNISGFGSFKRGQGYNMGMGMRSPISMGTQLKVSGIPDSMAQNKISSTVAGDIHAVSTVDKTAVPAFHAGVYNTHHAIATPVVRLVGVSSVYPNYYSGLNHVYGKREAEDEPYLIYRPAGVSHLGYSNYLAAFGIHTSGILIPIPRLG